MPSRTRPNILLLCTDQQRYDSLGCYGNAIHTPNLDRLAEQGALFENCYVQNTICSPSRASLFTGRYVRNHGLWANGVAMPRAQKMFTRALADVGYDCGMVGKQHLSACEGWQTEPRYDDGYRLFEWAHDPIHRSPQNAYLRWLKKKFPEIYADVFPTEGDPSMAEAGNTARGATPINLVPPEAHYSHWVAETAIDFITDEQRESDQPFFLIANFFDPHHPFGAPEEFRDLIDADALPSPVRTDGELATKPDVQAVYSRKSYGGAAPGFEDYSADEIKEIRAAYHAMIAMVDHEIGRILDALAAAGLAEDTLVVFSSDHGEMLGDHDILLKGPLMYDCCTRVPLIVRWPGHVPSGQRISDLVQWIDLTSTFVDVAGAAGFTSGQGRSLIPLLKGEAPDWRRWALCEYRDSGHQANPPVHTTMFRYENTKLVIWHGDPDSGREPDGEMYDLDRESRRTGQPVSRPATPGPAREDEGPATRCVGSHRGPVAAEGFQLVIPQGTLHR